MADAPNDSATPAKMSEADLKAVHDEAIRRADEAWEFERANIEEGREDQRFYAGDQWDSMAKRARGTDRPMLTVNRLPTFVRQLTGDVRKNTPAIKVLPAKGEATKEKADIYNGLIRNIEAESDADACYCIAVENAAIAGQGAFRIVTLYGDEGSFDQDIRIRPIRDPFGFLIDPLAQLPDKSDMGFAFVFERMSQEAFKKTYPDHATDDFPAAQGSGQTSTFDWRTGDSVRTAEYWTKEITTTKLYELEDGTITPDLPKGAKARRERDVENVEIVSYIMSGAGILSGPHPWAGKYIPICVVVGEEMTIDGATKRQGMVRGTKDAQRLYNYARTAAAESIALQPKAPYVVTVNQIAGFEPIWATAGTANHPYLPFNVDRNAPTLTPQRSQPAMGQQGLDSQALLAANDMEAVTGIFKANLGAPSNETSGVAIRSRQKEGDTGTYLYPDNLKRAISYAGRCLCDLIPEIYDSQRVVRILKEDGSHDMAVINEQVRDPMTGEVGTDPESDISLGKYDAIVSTGPSYLTRQQEMADDLVQLAGNMPIIGQVAPDLVVKALNFPGGDELAARLERTVPLQVREDPENLPPQGPTPEEEKIAAEAEKAKADADKAKAEAEGKTLENLQVALGMLQTLQGVPQLMQAMQQQLATLAGVQAPQGGPQQGGPPYSTLAGPVPMPSPGGPPGGPAVPPQDDGPGMVELEPMHPMGAA